MNIDISNINIDKIYNTSGNNISMFNINLPSLQLGYPKLIDNIPDISDLDISKSIEIRNSNLSTLNLSSFEYAYILICHRKISIPATYNVSKLKELIKIQSCTEINSINTLRSYINYIISCNINNIDFFKEHTIGSLITYFGIKTKHTFLIPSKFVNKKELVLAYYNFHGYDIWPTLKKYNIEQQILLDTQLQGIYVVNAGPGTGKTTVANERAYKLQSEGVLLISYTNEAINENHTRLKSMTGMRGKLCKKKYDKSIDIINVSTVDSLANHISPTKYNSGENYDVTVINAITLCQKLLKNRVKKYKHIIIDEAQDIDDLRGNLIMNYYAYSGAKSICIFGDPRQRIHEKNGAWYSLLWVQGFYSKDWNSNNGVINVNKIGFTYSYRFENRLHIEIANKLSARRPQIDHPLTSEKSVPVYSNEVIKLYSGISDVLDLNIDRVATFIKSLHENENISYSEMAVIGPSMNKENATSDLVGKICAVFKDNDIPCYVKMNGGFIPNAIYFGTVHSAKGKEFDHVFMFGADSFPETFNNIPYESAESLIYVMHTRARKRMYYISPKSQMFTPPRGLRPKLLNDANVEINGIKIDDTEDILYISNPELLRNQPIMVPPNLDVLYSISDLSTEFSLDRFLETNEYDINVESWFSFTSNIPKRPDDINERFWGIFCSFGVQLAMTNKYHDVFKSFISNEYKLVGDNEYMNKVRNGSLVNGRDIISGNLIIKKGLINTMHDYELESLKNILKKEPMDLIIPEMIFIAKIYDFLISGHMQSRYDINKYIGDNEILKNALINLAEQIQTTFGPCIEVEKTVNNIYMRVIGAIDSYHDQHVLEFKTVNRELSKSDGLQSQLYSLCTGKIPIVINLQNGKVAQVTSMESMIRWRYIIKSYTNLRTHIDEVISRKNKMQSKYHLNTNNMELTNTDTWKRVDKNMFTIDTEFVIGSSSILFEIAIINLHDPYRSIVQTINPGNNCIKQAMEWLSEPKELFIDSKNISDIKTMFLRLQKMMDINQNDVWLEYYVCNVDVSWWSNTNVYDLSKPIKHDAQNIGYITLGSAPPLSEYYAIKCSPVETQPHLSIHTAMTDALLLYEMIHLNKIP
uniref:UvrD-like helicase n=1 Tax=Pithovirus LCPAC102 TaxID=2506587 RepID=A0A481Z3Y8_9VIRU|nr:MAG: UvrD-like helicase [Pithovirus LCPAC102]